MATVTYNNESFICTTALKGTDYIHLLDASGHMIVAFDGVVDFSGFSISDGDWTSPRDVDLCSIAVIEDDGTLGESRFTPGDFLTKNTSPQMIGAATATSFSVTLPATGWDASSKSQTISSLPHSLHDDKGNALHLIVAPAPESHLVWGECMIRCTGHGATDVNFTCEDVPSVDLKANLLIVG